MKQILLFLLAGILPVFSFTQDADKMKNGISCNGQKDSTEVKITIFLEGPYYLGKMTTELNKKGLIPLSQPYNVPPWNYAGTESVSTIPNTHIVDWVLVDIRSADSAGSATSETIFAKKAGFLMDNGTIMNPDGETLLTFDTAFS